MALYSNFHYAIHTEIILGYLAMFLACLALIYTLSSYSSCLLRPDDLGKDIGLLCFRACLSILPVHPKGGGPGGARVATSYAGMVPGYAGSLRYAGGDSPIGPSGSCFSVSVHPNIQVSCRISCKDETGLDVP